MLAIIVPFIVSMFLDISFSSVYIGICKQSIKSMSESASRGGPSCGGSSAIRFVPIPQHPISISIFISKHIIQSVHQFADRIIPACGQKRALVLRYLIELFENTYNLRIETSRPHTPPSLNDRPPTRDIIVLQLNIVFALTISRERFSRF
jgi:hypothetical protein